MNKKKLIRKGIFRKTDRKCKTTGSNSSKKGSVELY